MPSVFEECRIPLVVAHPQQVKLVCERTHWIQLAMGTRTLWIVSRLALVLRTRDRCDRKIKSPIHQLGFCPEKGRVDLRSEFVAFQPNQGLRPNCAAIHAIFRLKQGDRNLVLPLKDLPDVG